MQSVTHRPIERSKRDTEETRSADRRQTAETIHLAKDNTAAIPYCV